MLTNLIYAAAGTPPTATTGPNAASGGSAWTVNISPNTTGLPGNNVWDSIAGGLMHWGLIASVIAIVVGAIVWQIAGHGHNPHWAARGRVGAVMGAGGALLIGAGPAIVNWAAQAGHSVH